MVFLERLVKIKIDYASYEQQRPLIGNPPKGDLEICVVIPCYNEPDIDGVLDSLSKCRRAELCEIIIVLNEAEDEAVEIANQNQKTWEALNNSLPNKYRQLNIHAMWLTGIEKKLAGVGTARRAGMDEAVRRLEQSEGKGIIACLDADCRVEPNYLEAILQAFSQYVNIHAFTIHFEHDLDSVPECHDAIVDYELHLRCHIEWQRWLGLPYAFQTIGSAMAVRAAAYVQQGRMNRRQAGEDFYFLHKFSSIGRLSTLNSTTVYPSSRTSDRVPFGTGKAVAMINEGAEQLTYHPSSYQAIKVLTTSLNNLYTASVELRQFNLPESARSHFTEAGWDAALLEIRENTASFPSFEKRFYRYFNAFGLMKYLHYMRKNEFFDVPVLESVRELYSTQKWENQHWKAKDYLLDLRTRAKQA